MFSKTTQTGLGLVFCLVPRLPTLPPPPPRAPACPGPLEASPGDPFLPLFRLIPSLQQLDCLLLDDCCSSPHADWNFS